ncbi:hypothetical protein [Delftia acidovorans]|uniref:hypothetical protein n=1 Tax=Delftia acidovorans TaxID=80866 RepID=UPI0022AB70E8|nr:hypothetical protein [Delftia acidovorans]WAT83731.1 hypothetical protein O1V13_20095 [Delftia acidovorans]
MSLDAVISADLVKTRAEIAALSSAVSSARSEIAGLTTQVNNSSVIKSVQRGIVSILYNATNPTVISIATVNPSKCLVSFLGSTGYFAMNDVSFSNLTRMRLLDSNRIEILKSLAGSGTTNVELSWEVVEFN